MLSGVTLLFFVLGAITLVMLNNIKYYFINPSQHYS